MVVSEDARRRFASIADTRAFLEGPFFHAPVGFAVFDAGGGCVVVNDAFRALFGSQPPPDYSIRRDEIAKELGVLEMIERSFLGETVSTPTFWYDPRDLRSVPVSEGRRVAISMTTFPLRAPAGAVDAPAALVQPAVDRGAGGGRPQPDRARDGGDAAPPGRRGRAPLGDAAAAPVAGAGRPLAGGAGAHEPRHQRARRHAAGRRADGRDARAAPGCALHGPPPGDPARHLRVAGGLGHGRRHGRRDARPHFRAVLHHQGGTRHRARPLDRGRDRPALGRPRGRLQRARPRHHLQGLPPARRRRRRVGRGGSRSTERGSETILLVEDERAVREYVRELLEENGYRVLEAGNGADALALCDAYVGTIDLVLTDVVLPDLGGSRLTEALMATRPDLRILYMSGYADDAVVRRGILQGSVAFIEKPFSSEALAAKLRDVLRRPPGT